MTNDDAEPQLAAGIAAVRRQDRAAARSHFAAVLARQPRHAAAWLWLSTVVDDVAQAQECVERVLRMEPEHPGALWRRDVLAVQTLLPALPATLPAAVAPPPPPNVRIGTLLRELGYVAPPVVEQAAQQQNDVPGQRTHLGVVLLQQRQITAPQLTQVLLAQVMRTIDRPLARGFRSIGYELLDNAPLSPYHLAESMTHQVLLRERGVSVRLGELLLQKRLIGARHLVRALDAQQEAYLQEFRSSDRQLVR